MGCRYKDLTNNGYKQFYLNKREHNFLFPNRKKSWKYRFEYYISDNDIKLYEFLSIQVKILQIVAFPINLVYAGISGLKGLLKEYKEMFNEKKYGEFISDEIWKDTDLYKKIKNKYMN